MERFKSKQKDGRSNQRVIMDYIKSGEPGYIYTYDELLTELNKNCYKTYDVKGLQSIINKSFTSISKEQQRALHCVPGIGYRLAPASFHLTLANDKQSKANKQALKGKQLLENVRWDEMDANHRMAHEGQLLIVSAIYENLRSLEKRQSKIESLIKKIGNSNEQLTN